VSTVEDGHAWNPPLDAAQLRRVLDRMSRWTPLDLDQVFDDLNRAQCLADGDPDLHEVVGRLRGTLANLVNICRTTDARQIAPETHLVADRAGKALEAGAGASYSVRRHRRRSARRDARQSPAHEARWVAWLTGELLELASGARLIEDVGEP
jgi:hypothetical protein